MRLLAAFGGRKHPAILIRVLLLLPEEKFGQRGCDGLIAGPGFCLRNAYATVIKIDLIVSHAKDFAMPHGCVEAKSDEQVEFGVNVLNRGDRERRCIGVGQYDDGLRGLRSFANSRTITCGKPLPIDHAIEHVAEGRKLPVYRCNWRF
ncbi:hypothetical protein O3305_20785 [Sphingomonas sp. NIBR02145]|nr:hypothetical protein [Sphingomonas sp. NIBR02145]WHU02585.1 hypothetical protein O3305_20785 [Sphingomonas sp. NIBR02145]